MATVLKMFRVGGKWYRHVLFTNTDAIELQDGSSKLILIFNSDARVLLAGREIGHFCLEEVDGGMVWVHYELPLNVRTVYGGDLILAEIEVSKRWILRNIPQPTAPIDSEGGHCD